MSEHMFRLSIFTDLAGQPECQCIPVHTTWLIYQLPTQMYVEGMHTA